jgi:uncharacterized protein YhjY with autotransporter beta-barrel domain
MGVNYYANHFNPNGDSPYWSPYHVSYKTKIQQIYTTFNVRVLDKQKAGGFLANIGFGYVGYRTKFLQTDLNNLHFGTEKGGTIGMMLGVGYDVPLSKMFAICLQASYHTGKITKFKEKNEVSGATWTETVSSEYGVKGVFKFSLGLRFAR